MPNKQASGPNFQFWDVLNKAMQPLREKYDVIIIDTPPTLFYLALASFMASDGMIIPLPPEMLDYASSTQFFRQFSELFNSMREGKQIDKEFEFIKIVLSKVKSAVSMTDIVKTWIKQTYPDTFRIVLSGEANLEKMMAAVNRRTINRFYAKPWNHEALVQSIRQAFLHPRLN